MVIVKSSRNKLYLGVTLALVVLVVGGMFLGQVLPGGRALATGGETGAAPDAGSISVTGEAVIKARPDTVNVTLGVESHGDTAAAAAGACTQAMNRVVSSLVAMGVPRDNIQTSNISLWPQYDYSREKEPAQVVGYRASNQVTLSWNRLDKVGELIDKAIAAGANTISGLSFTLADSRELYLEAVAAAVRDARTKADALAGAAGVSVGGVKNMSLHSYSGGPIVMREAMDLAGGAASVPVEPGQVEMRVTVNVEYGID